jgi:hypothetical protein
MFVDVEAAGPAYCHGHLVGPDIDAQPNRSFAKKTVEAGRFDRIKNASQASDKAWGWGPPRRV